MKKHFLFLLPLSVIIFFTACQKELSFELSGTGSAGSLQSDGTGECLPKTVQGVYEVGTVLSATTNYIDVQVNVTGVGDYRVYSDTVNGIFFQANGSFATAGLNTVRLAGGGTPLAAGIQGFTITFDSTECTVAIPTLPQGGAVDAEYTLAGSPDDCMNYVLAGDYVVGTGMTASNTVTINVNVTIPGTYNITTLTSNQLTFSGAGTLAATGAQTIILTASGTPAAAGNSNFPITAVTSSCNFTVTVTDAAATNDYFPSTAGSNWSYQFDDDPNDSLFVRAKPGTVTLAGNVYTVFEFTGDAAAGFAEANYRKSGSDYHTYADMGEYFGLDNAVNIDYIFLKDNVAAAATWQSGPINGTITDTSGIFPISIRIAFTIEQKDVAITVGGINYANTIVVVEKYEVFDGANWVDASALIGYFKSYYARGVGLIKQDYYYEDGNADPPVNYEQDIRRHQVF